MEFMNITLLLGLLPMIAWTAYHILVRWRQKYDHLPHLPKSVIFGSIKAFASFFQQGDLRRSTDYVFYDIAKHLGFPPVMMFDFRPLSYPVVVINSPEVAEQVAKPTKEFPHSAPKSPTLDKTKIFLNRLDDIARAGKPVKLDGYCVDLTFDIIGALVLGVDLNSQLQEDKRSALVRFYGDLLRSYSEGSGIGLPPMPWVVWRRNRLARTSDDEVKEIIRQRFAEMQAEQQQQVARSDGNKSPRTRCVLELSLQGIADLTPHVLQTISDNIRTFLFAGHDTTSILLQWAFYELSRTPRSLAALRAELDAVFGAHADAADMAAQLATRGEEALQQLHYTSAVIKEVLRLYPPAGSARRVLPGNGYTVRLPPPDGREVCLDGLIIYNCHFNVQRNPEVYGDTADDFVPERWLGGEEGESAANGAANGAARGGGEAKILPSAWRPFERGPRNCIGQELAILEAKVILPLAVRRYEFAKVGTGELLLDESGKPVLNAKGQYETKSEMFNVSGGISKLPKTYRLL